MKNYIICTLCVMFFMSTLSAYGPGTYGTWHPEIDNSFRPRLMFTSSDKNSIINRLSQTPYKEIYTMILEVADLEPLARPSDTWATTAERSYVAKNAAFVYYMNRQEDCITSLEPSVRQDFRDKIVNYLLEIDTAVQYVSYNPKTFFNMQWRGKELMNYCEAYDLIMGDADSYILANKDSIESNLHSFAANLFYTLDLWKNINWVDWLIIKQEDSTFTTKSNPRIMGACAVGIASLTIGNKGCDSPTRDFDVQTRKYRADSWIGAAMNTIYYLLRTNSSESMITSDGSYREGPHYLRYIGTIFLPFVKGMKNFESVLQLNNPSFTTPWYESYYNFGNDWDDTYSLQNL